MTQDYYKAETTKRYNIPLSHLDYSFIRGCTDVKELEKIIKVLRSGDEGSYPELEKEAEERLESLNPKSRVLRKEHPAMYLRDLDSSEREHISKDLESWENSMTNKENQPSVPFSKKSGAEDPMSAFEDDSNLPPVRSGAVITVDGKVKEKPADATENKSDSKSKKVMPRSYKEWDKFDIDKELEKADEEVTKPKKTAIPSTFKPERMADKVDTKGMSDQEKNIKAVREKEKGNEAFHARDYEESIVYYTRSISIAPLAATYNNRALAYLRLSKWKEATKDCNSVLSLEPGNVKALLRRGTALKGKEDLHGARADLEAVLAVESNNKTAQDLLKEVDKLEQAAAAKAKEAKKSGRRMIIEEVDGSDDEDNDDDVTEEIIVEQPERKKQEAPLLNGHVEDAPRKQADTAVAPPVEAKESSPAPSQPPNKSPGQQKKEKQQKETGKSKSEETSENKDLKTSKDIWEEEEADEIPQPPKAAPVEDKPKLLATNIISEPETQNGSPKLETSPDKELKGAGESAAEHKKDEQKTSTDNSQVPAATPPDVEERINAKVSEPEQSDEGKAEEGEKEKAVAEEPAAPVVHSRPVYVQKVLPPSAAEQREKGNNLFRSGQYPEAIEVYTKIIEQLENATDQVVNLSLIYSNRAACHQKTGNCQLAIIDCTTSLTLVPHSTKPLMRRAQAYETMERYRHAYVDYRHVISLDPSLHQAHQGASRSQHHLAGQDGHRWREKLPPLVQVSHWDVPEIVDENGGKRAAPQPTMNTRAPKAEEPTPPTELPSQKPVVEEVPAKKGPTLEERFEETKAQGNKHVQRGEYEAAAKCYCQCIDIFSDRAAVYTNRALCYVKLNKNSEAEADCNEALKLEPKNTKAFYRRALARKAQKQYKDCLQDLLQLLRLEPSNSAAIKEMDVVKTLYKREYDQLKSQPAPEKKKAPEVEKRRKRVKIEEVEDSDTDEKDSQPQQTPAAKPRSTGTPTQKPHSAPSAHQPSTHSSTTSTHSPAPADSKQTAARTPEAKKPGRGKSKKGGAKEATMGLPVTPPSAPKLQGKITPFEFIQHWNSLKQAKEIQPYVQLLEQISPDDLPGVISNKLDGHMLQIITRCAAHDAQTGEVERAYCILSNIRQVPRFSTVSMFLSNKEKQDIRKVLESISSLGTHSVEEIAAVRKDYGLK